MKTIVYDRYSISGTQRQYTDNGFLKVPGRVSRSGIQEYLASELGITDRAPNDIIRVMRPEEEVFNQDSLDTFIGSDVTLDHPPEMVDASNYSQYSVGTISSSPVRDGDFVQCELIIKDANAISAIQGGKVQLSVGYSAVYDNQVPDGADYDFIQREIRVNHTAICTAARAGAQARLFDNKPEITAMIKIVLDSGRSVEVEDQATATLISDTIDRLNASVDKANATIDQVSADRDGLKAKLDDATKNSADSVVGERVQAIAKTLDRARKCVSKDFACDSVDIVAIQRAALKLKRASFDWDSKSAVYIQAAFDQLEDIEDPEEEKEEGVSQATDSQLKQLAKDGAAAMKTLAADSRKKSNDSLTAGWKKTAGLEG